VAEIKKAARKDKVLGAEGGVIFLERVSGALAHVDSSSGAIGTAVNRAIETLVPIVAQAPASDNLRDKMAREVMVCHVLRGGKGPLKLKRTAGVPLISYPNAARPSHADQVSSLHRILGVDPHVAFEVRELCTALGLVRHRIVELVPANVCTRTNGAYRAILPIPPLGDRRAQIAATQLTENMIENSD
jgi:hypothetical protein